ncbi:hypothetical protein Tco_0107442 [Tanacetum coccineum]
MEKLESELWNHTMIGANHVGYTARFHELAKLVPHLVTPKSKRIGRNINGLAAQIHGMLRATQPTMIQSVILKARILIDEAIRCGTLTRSSEKRKEVEETSKQGGCVITVRNRVTLPEIVGHRLGRWRQLLFKNKAEIVCHEKVVRIPLESGEILRVQGKRTLGGMKTLMSTKAEELELSDIPILRDFIDVFLEDLLRLPPQ